VLGAVEIFLLSILLYLTKEASSDLNSYNFYPILFDSHMKKLWKIICGAISFAAVGLYLLIK
jgi:hypothetical protein